jgi:hypothetical protein
VRVGTVLMATVFGIVLLPALAVGEQIGIPLPAVQV